MQDILAEFNKEQEKFVSEKHSKRKGDRICGMIIPMVFVRCFHVYISILKWFNLSQKLEFPHGLDIMKKRL